MVSKLFFKTLLFIGKYGLLFVVASVFVSQYFVHNINPELEPSLRAFYTVVGLGTPFFLLIMVGLIHLFVNIPFEITKEFNRQIIKKDQERRRCTDL